VEEPTITTIATTDQVNRIEEIAEIIPEGKEVDPLYEVKAWSM